MRQRHCTTHNERDCCGAYAPHKAKDEAQIVDAEGNDKRRGEENGSQNTQLLDRHFLWPSRLASWGQQSLASFVIVADCIIAFIVIG